MQRIFKKTITGNTFGCIEFASLNEECILNILVVRKKKKQFIITNELTFTDISEMKESFNKALILLLRNKMVLSSQENEDSKNKLTILIKPTVIN
jgi:hypothetical protein